jgi:hypothetical protein
MRTTSSFLTSLFCLTMFIVPLTSASAQSFAAEGRLADVQADRTTVVLQRAGTFDAAQEKRRSARLLEQAWQAQGLAPASPASSVDGFETSGFAQFMSSTPGRILRVVAGAGMIAGGIAADSDFGTGLAVAGAVPLLAGTFDFCVLSPLFGGPFSGKAIRAAGK